MHIYFRIANTVFGALLATSPLSIGTLLPSSLSAQTASYFVSSQNGNDSWSGLSASPNSARTDGPFQTLARAQGAMRLSSVKAVNLRAGTYSINSPLQISALDSGELWISYGGETAILDGGGTGGINVTAAHDITFEGLTFQNIGGRGLYINFGNNIVIRSNNFSGCSQSCVGGGAITNSTMDSNTMKNQNTSSGAAISLWTGSSNNQIIHNRIENCQGSGVSFSAGLLDPPNSNNIVDRNIFQNVANNGMDAGAVYMFDRSHSAVGNRITNNVINGVGGDGYLFNWTKAIYLDDLVSHVLVSGNICRSCGEWAWQNHAGDHNTIVNNIFDLSASGTLLGLYQTENSDFGLGDYGMNGNVFERNIVYFSGGAPSNLYQVNIGSSDALPANSGNLYYSASGASIPNGQITDAHPVYDNPQFADPSAGNYSMPSSSPAYTVVGFQPLPTDQGPSGAAQAASTGGNGSIANGTYTIKNNSSGLVLDDPGWAAPGAQVIQYFLDPSLPGNQRWVVAYDSAKQGYTIVNEGSGGFLTDSGAALFENASTGDATQVWTIFSSSGAYVIRNAATGRAIDDPAFSPNSTGIITWPVNGGSNQSWSFQ